MQCSVENVLSTVALKFTKLRDPNDQNYRLGDYENYGKPEISNAEYSRLREHFARRIMIISIRLFYTPIMLKVNGLISTPA